MFKTTNAAKNPAAWTPERIEKLKALLAAGNTYIATAKQLGGFQNYPDKGRNAVVGKARRLGLVQGVAEKSSVTEFVDDEAEAEPHIRKVYASSFLSSFNHEAIPRALKPHIPRRKRSTCMIRPVENHAYGDALSPFPKPADDASDPYAPTAADIAFLEKSLYNFT